jgi:hypothetical protein
MLTFRQYASDRGRDRRRQDGWGWEVAGLTHGETQSVLGPAGIPVGLVSEFRERFLGFPREAKLHWQLVL